MTDEIIEFSPSVQVTPVGMIFKNGIEIDEWLEIGKRLDTLEGALSWWMGDYYNYGDRMYGELAA